MKLEEFISETIKQVLNGVMMAQDYAKEKGGSINPSSMRSTHSKSGYYDQTNGQAAHDIDFDIAITTKEEGETKAGVGVFVTVFKAGIQDKNLTGNFSENRIKFSIPIFLPQQKT